jgi:hypothetical protein
LPADQPLHFVPQPGRFYCTHIQLLCAHEIREPNQSHRERVYEIETLLRRVVFEPGTVLKVSTEYSKELVVCLWGYLQPVQ